MNTVDGCFPVCPEICPIHSRYSRFPMELRICFFVDEKIIGQISARGRNAIKTYIQPGMAFRNRKFSILFPNRFMTFPVPAPGSRPETFYQPCRIFNAAVRV